MDNQADFYCVGEKDFITTETIEEAVLDWYENCCEYDLADLDIEYVEVQGFRKKNILTESSKLPEWWIEHIVENLDENYGCEELWGEYSPSEEAMEHFNKFVDCIRKEYPVAQLEEVGEPTRVNVRDHIRE